MARGTAGAALGRRSAQASARPSARWRRASRAADGSNGPVGGALGRYYNFHVRGCQA